MRGSGHHLMWACVVAREGHGQTCMPGSFSGSPMLGAGSEPGLAHMDSLSSWKVSLLAKLCGVSSKGKQEVKRPS